MPPQAKTSMKELERERLRDKKESPSLPRARSSTTKSEWPKDLSSAVTPKCWRSTAETGKPGQATPGTRDAGLAHAKACNSVGLSSVANWDASKGTSTQQKALTNSGTSTSAGPEMGTGSSILPIDLGNEKGPRLTGLTANIAFPDAPRPVVDAPKPSWKSDRNDIEASRLARFSRNVLGPKHERLRRAGRASRCARLDAEAVRPMQTELRAKARKPG